jgi:hypothetical protein
VSVRPSRPASRTTAGHSDGTLTLAAVWTGAAAAGAGALAGMIAVALSWLPVSGAAGNSSSVVRAGLLTFLASLHGGITVSGAPSAFLPLGLLIATGALTWRAGAALSEAATAAGEYRTRPLVRALAAQAVTFAGCCLVAALFSRLGTSSVNPVKVAVAALAVCAVPAGTAVVRSTPLRAELTSRVPLWLPGAARDAAAALAAYCAVAALLVAGSLAWHGGRVRLLFGEVGGGWGAVPVLVLDLLAAPNAVLAAVGYLSGPGFAVGAHTAVGPLSGATGPVPAFPVLGALPDGPASPVVWALVGIAPVLAAAAVARRVRRAGRRRARLVAAARASGVLAGMTAVLAWQAGGGIGGGRLAAVGPSPWRTGLALGVEVLVATVVALGVQALAVLVHARTPTLALRRLTRRRGERDLAPAESGEADRYGDVEDEAVGLGDVDVAPAEDAAQPIDEQPTEPIRTGRLAG